MLLRDRKHVAFISALLSSDIFRYLHLCAVVYGHSVDVRLNKSTASGQMHTAIPDFCINRNARYGFHRARSMIHSGQLVRLSSLPLTHVGADLFAVLQRD
jgi:hypothetical protein